jgi:ATP-dependent 26S proteasome regulatory subunit
MLVEDKAPTLGEILNVLDGVPERHGHILVLDTNHLASLDPALIRPGRVDRILSWRPLSAASVRSFLENYYQVQVAASAVFPDRKWTAAELQGAAAAAGASWADFTVKKGRKA